VPAVERTQSGRVARIGGELTYDMNADAVVAEPGWLPSPITRTSAVGRIRRLSTLIRGGIFAESSIHRPSGARQRISKPGIDGKTRKLLSYERRLHFWAMRCAVPASFPDRRRRFLVEAERKARPNEGLIDQLRPRPSKMPARGDHAGIAAQLMKVAGSRSIGRPAKPDKM